MGISDFVERTVARVARSPVALSALHPDGIPGNIVSGAAGVAYFLHEAARLRGNERLLERAREWSAAARKWADNARPKDWRGADNGFMDSAGGLALVEALLAVDPKDAELARARLARPPKVGAHASPTELYGGTAGSALAATLLAARTGAQVPPIASPPIEATANPLLGMAHGRAGEAWAHSFALGPRHPFVRRAVEDLWSRRETDVSGLVFWRPSIDGGDLSLVDTWCHGVIGQSLLFTSIAARAPTKNALERARRTAESAILMPATNPTVCCGLAGQSVVLQRYANLSGDARFARRAYQLLARATRDIEGPTWSKVTHGLWQGALGVALVAMGRLAGEHVFPVIEPLSGE